jgi:acyl transferase domain-containing protein/acyl carrier protein
MNNSDSIEKTGLEIAVIGMAGRFPGARDLEQYWDNLIHGIESVTYFFEEELENEGIPREVLNNSNYVKAKSLLEEIEYFDAPFFGYTPREAEKMDPQIRLLHECAWHALEDAGYDPGTYKGAIGFYAGAQNNISWQVKVMMASAGNTSDQFDSSNLSDKDHLSTRISYKLDFTGPSFTLETQCSTSLVALHLACQGILSGECDMALAGGVTLTMGRKTGYMYQDGMILASDGHVRSFDARADGSIFGEGAGMVLLKPLADAVDDNDHIIAVIKSSFINNDGNRKVGYAAPSVDGQAEVIKTALELAGVEAESIGYIEAHGTATPLGDQIEIEALKLAFDTEKRNFCRLGTVKTNVGHLDNAAGIAGFIKAALVLQHRTIPPSLHFETANPALDLENSPFTVNTCLHRWERTDGIPLRAGVSSFGIGGTNVHVIMEEAPARWDDRPPARDYQLLVLSALTESAAHAVSDNLAEYFERHPEIDLADAAYTLQTGRKSLPYRKMLVCSSVEEAADGLKDRENCRVFFNQTKKRPLYFMFPGVGAQYVNMGRQLYDEEPFFRREMDRCFDILKPLLDWDLREVLYPSAGETGSGAEAGNGVSRPEQAQPVLFSFEYALAKLLMHWGFRPDALIGYSFGEYTAACIAGVFSLEEALRLIVTRSRLLGSLSGGVMLSVPLPASDVQAMLPAGLSVAIDNGPSCIAAGPAEAVSRYADELKAQRYMCMQVPNSHAMHSPMMEPILEEFEKTVAEFSLKEPQIPYISNVTGTWAVPAEVTSPAYWSRHLRQTVRFADGIKELVKENGAVFVETGPGRDLQALIMRHIEAQTGSDQYVINLVRPAAKEISDQYYLLNKIGWLWLYGFHPDRAGFYREEQRARVQLPRYPFERERYWIDINPFAAAPQAQAAQGKLPDIADWFSFPQWQRSLLLPAQRRQVPEQTCWLVFIDDTGFGKKIAEQLRSRGQEVVTVEKGDSYAGQGDAYTVNVKESKGYRKLLADLQAMNRIPANILHFWGVTCGQGADRRLERDAVDHAQDLGLYSLLYLTWAIGKLHFNEAFYIYMVSDNVYEVSGDEILCPEKSPVIGLARTVQQEFANITCRCIDIVLPESGSPAERKLAAQLLEEFNAKAPDMVIAYRNNYRWVEAFDPIRLEDNPDDDIRLREKGVYLITGGLGAVGFYLSGYLAETFKARLILTGRTALPPRSQWEEYLAGHDETDSTAKKIRKVKHLESLGSEVLTPCADVADTGQMTAAVAEAEAAFGAVHGVIHAAGIVRGETFRTLGMIGKNEFRQHFHPKVYGLLAVAEVFEHKPLDFCLLVSTPASILGGLGFAAYASANMFLDTFVYRFNREHANPWITVNWGDWQEEQAVDKNTAIGESVDIMLMTPEEGVKTFELILKYFRSNQVVVSAGDLQDRIDKWVKLEFLNAAENKKPSPGSFKPRPPLMNPYVEPTNPEEELLAGIWSNMFGFEKIGINDDFFELGGDSLKAITAISLIHKELNTEVPLEAFFTGPTIEKLARLINVGSAPKSEYVAIEPSETKEYFPLSSSQKRLYILQQLEKESVAYNETEIYLLVGPFDRERFEDALSQLVERHEVLRSSIRLVNGEPVQIVHSSAECPVVYDSQEESGMADRINDFIQPFDLEHPPFFRIGVFEVEEERRVLVRDMHHLITDGVSTEIFISEFITLYYNGRLTELQLQYKDYAQWQASQKGREVMQRQEQYWLSEFADEVPALRLPLDYTRPEIQSFEGSSTDFLLEKKETAAIKDLAAQQDVTLYMVLLGIFYVFLSRISGQEDIVIGTSVAGRRHADLQYIMGVFVNTLALRHFPRKEKSFEGFLQEIKENTLKAFDNQEFQFEDLIEKLGVTRDMSRNPLFDVQFVLQNQEIQAHEISPQGIPENQQTGVGIRRYPHESKISKFDLRLDAIDLGERLALTFEYCTKLFKAETIERFIDYFKEIVGQVVENPAAQLKDIAVSHNLAEVSSEIKDDHYSGFAF